MYKLITLTLFCFMFSAAHAKNLIPSAENWIVVNDSVMGGVSSSRVFHDRVSNHHVFQGNLSLDNNGGFSSIRSLIRLEPPTKTSKLRLSVKGDGRQFQLRFRTDKRFDGVSYSSRFKTEENKITTAIFEASDFVPVWRGRLVRNAPELNWLDVTQIGVMVSDKQVGQFQLELIQLEWID